MKIKNFVISVLFVLSFLSARGQNNADVFERTEISTNEKNDDNPVVSLVDGGVEITVGDDKRKLFHIFAITGQLVKKVEVSGPANRIDLPKGCYIIKSDGWSKKVVVR